MDRKTILALVVSALVIFGYQLYVARFYPVTRTAEVDIREKAADLPQPSITEEARFPKSEKAVLERVTEPGLPPKTVSMETEKYIVTLSNEGGCIKSIILKEYPYPGTNEMFELVGTDDTANSIFNMSGLGEYDLSKVRFRVDEKYNEIIFSAKLRNGLELNKKYIFHNSLYHIELELYISNPTNQALTAEYSIVASSNIAIATKLDRRYVQIVSEISGKTRRDGGKKDNGMFVEGSVKYTGLQDKYFSVIAKTSIPTKGARLRQIGDNNLLSQIEIDKFIVNPQTDTLHTFLLYVGPTKKDIMKEYNLAGAVSYGFFGGISEILLAGLKLLQRIFRNWGVAIILLSALVNLLLFPLSRKSYASMKKMQELQPHMEKLRNDHKDNPQKLNKETMELYKRYNVNPLGGCLPMLLQIPIFVALYQALMRSLELRGAHFLWIRDLSMPDAVPLPFTLPVIGNSLNLLPIFMAAAMVIQQKVSTRKGAAQSAQAKQQQQMMVMMPVIFLLIMYNFPSGLVLYWLTNTILTVCEQRAIMHS